MRPSLVILSFLAAASLPVSAQTPNPIRLEAGNRITENLPEIPAELIENLNQYQNTRGASFAGWTTNGCMLISTRFADTAQAHRVCDPLGMREQLSFYKEPVVGITASPAKASRHGFVFAKDKGGDEFSQLYWYDAQTRAISLLTDGKRSQNSGTVLNTDGSLMAYSSTSRNGTDTDIWLRDTKTGVAKPLVIEGGSWRAMDFSPNGKSLLVARYVAADDTRPGKVDLASGKLTLFPVEGGKAAFGGFEYAHNGKGVYFVSDENAEFQQLRHHDPASGKTTVISKDIPWNVSNFSQSDDGTQLAFVTNEDGVSVLRVLNTKNFTQIPLPALPLGVVGGLEFTSDGKRIALSINTATSPSDVYVLELANKKIVRWTRSEVGGLDTATFTAPTLVHFKSFDGRTIPAFYYRPAGLKADEKVPVLINIHGGPEGQALPTFSPNIQYLMHELKIAVLVPNVRGSSGYGKTYLEIDNGYQRKDSVKDIGALLDWIALQPGLDKERVGVVGGSYGGYMVLASMVDYNSRLRAGVDIVGISNFNTFLKNTESYRRDLRRVEYGDERDPKMAAFLEEIAPLNNAGKISKPLFVAQGLNDPRVPYTEAEQMVKAVRGNGGDVWFLMFKDEGHGFRKKQNSDFYGASEVLFWKKYLLGK
ncbi:MAG: prolyl oligopeptidase family serine peptidase [Pseudomonadota bacterium]